LLCNIGIGVLKSIVDDGEPIDLQPADVIFAGEIAVSVAAAKNGQSDLLSRIAKIECEVPQPLFDIADAIGCQTDDLGTVRSLENAEKLAVSHLIAACATDDPLGQCEDIDKIVSETEGYVAYPKADPRLFVPIEYTQPESYDKCARIMERVSSPKIFSKTPNSLTKDFHKFKKNRKGSATLMDFLDYEDKKLGSSRESSVTGYLLDIARVMIRDKYSQTKAFASRIGSNTQHQALGIIDIDNVFKIVKVRTNRCARSIGRLFKIIMPCRNTRELTKEGTFESLMHSGANGSIICQRQAEAEELTLAYVAQYKIEPTPHQCIYTPGTHWESFVDEWIRSFLKEDFDTGDPPN